MKKKRTLLLIAVLVLFSAWYFRPRSFDDTLSGFDPEGPVTACYAILPASGTPGTLQVELPVDSQAYEEVLAQLRSTTYIRDFSDLLRLGRASDSQVITLDPYYAHFYLRQGEALFEWSFYGPQMVAEDFQGGAQITYRPIGGTGFQQGVLDLLVSHQTD